MIRRGPVFLARRSYRLRRLRDGARLLPVVGTFFFLLPILWQPAQTESRDTAFDGLFIFAVWAVLIVVAAILSRGLGTGEEAESPAGHDDDEGYP